MNLPNSISAGRIAAAPLIAALPFIPSVGWRLLAFGLYLVTAISDHVDGYLARSRGQITDLGKVLDPLADKLLLLATFVPMFLLQGAPTDWLRRLLPPGDEGSQYGFTTWGLDAIHFPWWVLVLILGREAFMTWFREFARKRGAVIAAQRLGKWKAGFQYTWVGAAYFWFAYALWTRAGGHAGPIATFFANLLGGIGLTCMIVAFFLTLISLADYLVRHRALFART